MAKFKKSATFIREDDSYSDIYSFVRKIMEENNIELRAYFDENNSFFRVDIPKCNQKLKLQMLEKGFEEI